VSDALTCPWCQGRKQKYLHLNYGPGKGGEWKWVDCYGCDGAGELTGDRRLAVEAGQRLMARRRAAVPKRMVMEEARRLGLDDVELSNAEMGRLPLLRIQEIEAMPG
jgi:hypothetical protein